MGVVTLRAASYYRYEVSQQQHAVAQAQQNNLILQRQTAQEKAILTQKEQDLNQKNADLAQLTQQLAGKAKQIDDANKKIAAIQKQIAGTSAQLAILRQTKPLFSFSIESKTITNVEQKKQDVEDVVTAAYDEIVNVYSKPYLLHEVIISFVDSTTIPGAYAEIKVTNGSNGLTMNIRIRDFDKHNFLDVNAIIHEIIHSFHGLALLDPTPYEEGITVAATDAVMTNLEAQKKIDNFSPLYIRIGLQDYLNSSLTVPRGDSFYTDGHAADYYQLIGFGWYEIYKADKNFFKTFNEKLYQKVHDGNTISEGIVKQLVKDATSATVDGRSIDDWVKTKAFALN